jgi:hypothetical protein
VVFCWLIMLFTVVAARSGSTQESRGCSPGCRRIESERGHLHGLVPTTHRAKVTMMVCEFKFSEYEFFGSIMEAFFYDIVLVTTVQLFLCSKELIVA